jgi:hypothetical protein
MACLTVRWGAVWLAVLATGLASCGDGGEGVADAGADGGASRSHVDYVLLESAKQLDATTLGLITDIAADGSTIMFTGSSPVLDSLAPRHVLLGGPSAKTPGGLLRLVTAVERPPVGIMEGWRLHP